MKQIVFRDFDPPMTLRNQVDGVVSDLKRRLPQDSSLHVSIWEEGKNLYGIHIKTVIKGRVVVSAEIDETIMGALTLGKRHVLRQVNDLRDMRLASRKPKGRFLSKTAS